MYYYLKLILTNKLTKMKRLFALFIVVVLAIVFLSCESKSGKRYKQDETDVSNLTVENPSRLVRIDRLSNGVRMYGIEGHKYLKIGTNESTPIHAESCNCMLDLK